MVKDIPLAATYIKNRLDSEIPLVWLYEVRTKSNPPKMIRLTSETSLVTYNGNAYYPAPITHAGIEATSEGDLPQVEVTIGNASLEVAAILEASDGLIGQQIRVTVAAKTLLADTSAAIFEEADIVSASMSSDTLTIRASARNAFRSAFPPFRYTRRKCRWLYGSTECGVDLDQTDGFTLTECPGYTLSACVAVGDAEVAAGRPRLHPERGGFFPAIPRSRSFA